MSKKEDCNSLNQRLMDLSVKFKTEQKELENELAILEKENKDKFDAWSEGRNNLHIIACEIVDTILKLKECKI